MLLNWISMLPDWIYHILAAIGSLGVIIIGISKFAGNIIENRLKEKDHRATQIELKGIEKETAIELEKIRQLISVNTLMIDKYATSQNDVYQKVWKHLQSLKRAVNNLWGEVTPSNLEKLLRELHTTEKNIDDWSLLINEKHYRELKRLFEIVKSFQTGKLTLRKIQKERDLDYVKIEQINRQIEENRQFKEDLADLLDKLRNDFREKLSTFKGLDNI